MPPGKVVVGNPAEVVAGAGVVDSVAVAMAAEKEAVRVEVATAEEMGAAAPVAQMAGAARAVVARVVEVMAAEAEVAATAVGTAVAEAVVDSVAVEAVGEPAGKNMSRK